ncbi:CheR family methyltransferase [Thiorhodospira sibirica]|uniref:CheR family methyltransferase n=1 Tax=Thiorhodospira sibirica TaxID=154347 RepID=UPI00022C22AE|nr:protein-glutamate O-methyltransferase CheR [Thiorhodospira sibirica]
MITRLDDFSALVKRRCGLVFDQSNIANLADAVVERMALRGLDEVSAYLAYLQRHDEEFHELVTRLTINETYFFREAEHFRLLTESVLPPLLRSRSSPASIRILSAGCSTGEEPYSIAMALQEAFGEDIWQQVTLMGADIDHKALERARAATYNSFSFRGLSPQRQRQYFQPLGHNLYCLHAEIRSRVQFVRFNLLEEPPSMALMGGQDVIFFRNVSIYFDTATRRTVQHNLHRLLNDGGVFIVGSAESMANDLGIFQLVEDFQLFYFKKSDTPTQPARPPALRKPAAETWQHRAPVIPARPAAASISPAKIITPPAPPAPAKPAQPPETAPPVSVQTSAPPPLDSEALSALIREERYQEAEKRLHAHLTQQPHSIPARLLLAYIELHTRQFAQAAQRAQAVLADDAWNVDAFMLLGLCAKWQPVPDHEQALRCFKQAVYTCHDCWIAHYYLAESYRALQNIDLARRAYRVTLQQLNHTPRPNGGIFLPLRISVSEIRFLCQHHSQALAADARPPP